MKKTRAYDKFDRIVYTWTYGHFRPNVIRYGYFNDNKPAKYYTRKVIYGFKEIEDAETFIINKAKKEGLEIKVD